MTWPCADIRCRDEKVNLKTALESYRQTILKKDDQLRWYAEGTTLLMALMNGRGIVPEGSAERKVYEEWRKRGTITEAL